MSKKEFLAALFERLDGMPQEDIDERLTFYSEMIDDRMEEGVTEDAAVAELGSVDEIILQIMSEIPLSKLLKEKVKTKRTLRAWEIILLVLGSPIWLSLIIAMLAVIFSIYVVIWSLIVSLWAVELALVACSFAGIFSCGVFLVHGNAPSGLAMLGAGLVCCGIAILGYFGCKQATKAILLLSKKIFIGIKSLFIKKEGAK